ncbi:uncharacterized protein LOC116179519 [Photinus pyralis]|uniref:uncharacterized protein LOC116179519 n=1 Tax=Photinus pyralis TaxID=7054 RepID=UPI00126777CA|nr:uncharacterized protein LOC116179519 [Photinus pyralis]
MAHILDNVNTTLEMIAHFYKNYNLGSASKVPKFINIIDANLRQIQSSLAEPLTVGDKRHLAAVAGKMERYKVLINQLGKPIAGSSLGRRPLVEWRDLATAFKSRVSTGIIINLGHKTLGSFFNDSCKLFITKIRDIYPKYNSPLKTNFEFCAEFVKPSLNKNDEALACREFSFLTKNFTILSSDLSEANLKQLFNNNAVDYLMERLMQFEEQDSGWGLSKIISLTVNVNSVTLMHASSFIELPKEIQVKKAVINVKNNDEACFGWALSSALFPATLNTNRISSYPYYAQILNFDGISFPMSLDQLQKFLKQNPNLSINIYGLTRKTQSDYVTVPIYLNTEKKANHVNLLMIQQNYEIEKDIENNATAHNSEEPDEAVRFHFCWIKDLSRLVRSQLTKGHGKLYICDRCLHYFSSPDKLNAHELDCKLVNKCKINMPEPGSHVYFKNHEFKQTAPFIIYCDLECLVQDFQDDETQNTVKYKQHNVCSIAYYLHCTFDNSLSRFRLQRGEQCINWFTSELEEISNNLQQYFINPVQMEPLNDLQMLGYNASTYCHICEGPILPPQVKVRDHCHFTGRFRGSAHQACNLRYKAPHMIPIFFHNFSRYDSHFIIKDIAQAIPGRVTLLPKNKERYISFTKKMENADVEFRFVDSYRFMSESLDNLASYLKFDDFKILRSTLSHLNDEQLKLLTKKGVYPYEYMDSWEKFNETNLPEKIQFYSKLRQSHISDQEYSHARNVWRKFETQNLGQYSDLYLMSDVLILADVFTNFREKCITTHKLDPAFFFTAPGYTWQCMLNYTKVKLELLTDVDMMLFVEKGIRGGITQCCTKYSKANNKYLNGKNYDPTKPPTHIMYMDMVNLYGWAQSQCLPLNNFKWLSEAKLKSLTPEAILNTPDDAVEGLILEVDLLYPRQLHDQHKSIPFCVEHDTPPGAKNKKLLATLHSKTRYVIHYRNLKQCLQAGLILERVHRAINFKQSCWLKPYIDLNARLRAQATNAFEKNLYKLLNNANFGKTMENVRNHRIIKLVTRWSGRYGANYYISQPNFHSREIFDDELLAIELSKTEILFNKPLYVGMAILEISKTRMYDFHYNFMQHQFSDDRLKLLYMDTDSLVYEMVCDDAYELIRANISRFDTSDYPENNIYNIPRCNGKVLGMMKDELGGRIITDWVALASKMYSYKTMDSDNDVMKLKGIRDYIVKNRLSFNDYLECLRSGITKSVTQSSIISKNHHVYSMEQHKIALSNNDNKRYLMPNGIDTLPWGHYSIPAEMDLG